MNLAAEFIKSRGAPIRVKGQPVIQGDRLQLKHGTVRIRFLGERPSGCGLALKSARGWIVLSDGQKAKLVYIWDDPGLAREVTHEVHAPDGELRIWNIYRIVHLDGKVSVDSWTGNAGMVLKEVGPRCRQYGCSSCMGDFDPTEMLVEVSWEPL